MMEIDRTRIEQIRRVHAMAPEACGGAVAFLLSQIDALDRAVAHWRANHGDMVRRAALLSQRPDLPVDRLPAYHEMKRLQQVERLAGASPLAAFDAGPWRYHQRPEESEHLYRYFVESGDFGHDVRLYVNGDFADDIERAVYGHALADTLNARAAASAKSAADGLAAGDDLVPLLRQLRTELEAQDVLFEWWGIIDAAVGEPAP